MHGRRISTAWALWRAPRSHRRRGVDGAGDGRRWSGACRLCDGSQCDECGRVQYYNSQPGTRLLSRRNGGHRSAGFAIGEIRDLHDHLLSHFALLLTWDLDEQCKLRLSSQLRPQASAPTTQVVSYTVTGNNQDTTLTYTYDVHSRSFRCNDLNASQPPARRSLPPTSDSEQAARVADRREQAGGGDLRRGDHQRNRQRDRQRAQRRRQSGHRRAERHHASTSPPSRARRWSSAPTRPSPRSAMRCRSRRRRACRSARPWSVWAEVRGTGWDRNHNAVDLRGNQLNVTARRRPQGEARPRGRRARGLRAASNTTWLRSPAP